MNKKRHLSLTGAGFSSCPKNLLHVQIILLQKL